MYNRRERRRIEKELGISKLIKEGPREIKEILLKKRKEESLALQKERQENLEATAREEEVQRYARTLQLYTEELGYSVEEAEKKIEAQRIIDEERAMRKRKRRTT